ncbi:S41 family peptidase [Selenomonas sp. KH1T6]|uniref:S41 family peptidase n=1 Tax=Selenomonas sp. KH1T6 TaxID=3158784 RepID=UPI0008A736F9|nr:Peptidase family S41 [Selenomonas ruminantium]
MHRRKLPKKLLCGLLTGWLLLSGAPALGEAAEVTGSFDSRIYASRLDRYDTLRVYNVAGEETVPYVSAQEYLRLLYDGNVAFQMEEGSSVLTAVRNGIRAEFDGEQGIIRCEDWDAFFGSYGERALPNGILLPGEFNAQAVSKKHPSSETKATGFDINLSSYGLAMTAYEGQMLLPFAVLQNVFAMPSGASDLSFNGDHFYDIAQPIGYIYGHDLNPGIRLNPYATAYYSGKFSKMKEIPSAYAHYAYGTTCLLFDLYYGHKKEKGIESFDKYFEQNGLKEGLLSTDARRNSEAFLEVVYKLFDSGHDSVQLSHSVFDTGSYINTAKVITAYGGMEPTMKALQKLTYKVADKGVDFLAGETGTYGQYETACKELQLDPVLLTYIFRDDSGQPFKYWLEQAQEYVKIRGTKDENFQFKPGEERKQSADTNRLFEIKEHIESLKPADFGNSRVDIIDDTAFIYFEGFEENLQEASFYYRMPDESVYDTSTFGLFYDAFAKIQQDPKVKKVVIDLSNNGGGAVGALTAVLGFLAPDGEVNLTYFHTLNQNYCSEWYHVDTNLDGKFDARDGFGGQYDFYILTSGFSYSCGNALPFFAQTNGLAKIIGEQPGGGDCAVAPFLDAYGHVANMSGWSKLGRMEDGKFVSDEHAVKVDYPFGDQADKLYFNYKSIAEWLSKK